MAFSERWDAHVPGGFAGVPTPADRAGGAATHAEAGASPRSTTGEGARRHLLEVARRAAPAVPAVERRLPVGGALGALLPGAGLQRGSVAVLDGASGAGTTSTALALAAEVTAAGEWAAFVDPDGTLGGAAAAEAGVALERFAVVRRFPAARWPAAVAALLDGLSLVVAAVPVHLRPGDARRLVARARERAAVLIAVGGWPAEAALRVRVDGGCWPGLGTGCGLLAPRALRVRVEGRAGAVEGEVAFAFAV